MIRLGMHTIKFSVETAGAAAMLELAAEPLYILSTVQLRFRLRVGAEAAATLARGGLTLLLLARAACAPAIALSWGQACLLLSMHTECLCTMLGLFDLKTGPYHTPATAPASKHHTCFSFDLLMNRSAAEAEPTCSCPCSWPMRE